MSWIFHVIHPHHHHHPPSFISHACSINREFYFLIPITHPSYATFSACMIPQTTSSRASTKEDCSHSIIFISYKSKSAGSSNPGNTTIHTYISLLISLPSLVYLSVISQARSPYPECIRISSVPYKRRQSKEIC